MTAAERAAALLEGRDIDCPRCGAFPMKQQADYDLGWMFGGRVEGRMTCESCGLECARAMACVAGQPDDESAAIQFLPEAEGDAST